MTTRSEETRAKMSEAKKGKKRPPFTEEHKQNMAVAMRLWHAKRKIQQSGGTIEMGIDTKEILEIEGFINENPKTKYADFQKYALETSNSVLPDITEEQFIKIVNWVEARRK